MTMHSMRPSIRLVAYITFVEGVIFFFAASGIPINGGLREKNVLWADYECT